MNGSYFTDDTAVVTWAKVSEAEVDKVRIFSELDPQEQERAAKFRFEEDRLRFALGRFLTRSLLSREFSEETRAIKFSYTERQRPVLELSKRIEFSITHARDLVAVAFAKEARIGIDIEHMDRKVDLMGVAEKVLSAEDFLAFQALPKDEKVPAFFRIWTRKEAYLKATGEGITDGLKRISVSLQAEEMGTISDTRDQASAASWRLYSLALPPDYMSCVACERDRKFRVMQIRFLRTNRDGE